MSDCTPNLATIESAYVNWALLADRGIDASEAAAEFDRFIAKVKADALREAAESARAVIDIGNEGDSAYHHGARYGQHRFADWLDVRAERIEGGA